MKLKITLVAAACALVSHGASAEERNFPALDIDIHAEIQADKIRRSQQSPNRLHDVFTDSEASVTLSFTPSLAVKSLLHLEPVRSPVRDREFGGHGLYLEEFYLSFETEPLDARAGKYNPGFGITWDRAPGIYGSDFAEDYEITEGIGVGAGATVGSDRLGQHRLGANAFFQDSTPLSNSALTRPRVTDADVSRPGQRHKTDGGIGNTRRLDNFTITLDGDDTFSLGGLGYHLGYLYRSPGVTELSPERGYAAGVNWTIKFTEDLALVPLAEYVFIDRREGRATDTTYVSVAMELQWEGWRLSAARTGRKLDDHATDGSGPNGGDFRDRLVTASFGYEFDFGVGASVGWKSERAQGVSTRTLGVLLTYDYSF
jgi:hypothetical protein